MSFSLDTVKMDQNEGIEQELKSIRSQLSEEERKGKYGRMLSYVDDIIQGGWSFRQAEKNLGELQSVNQIREKVENMLAKNVDKLATGGKEAILEVLEYQRRNCSDDMVSYYHNKFDFSLEEYYEDTANDRITEHENTKKQLIDGMRSYCLKERDKLIKDMVKSSAVVAVVQLLKMRCAWEKISNASNVIKDKNRFTTIYQNLNNMENRVAELLELCEERPIYHGRITLQMALVNRLFYSILWIITNLKVTIGDRIQRLNILADNWSMAHNSAIDGVANTLSATYLAYQLWYSWGNLSSFGKWLGGASIAVVCGLLAYENYHTYGLSRDALLKDLRKKMRKAADLQGRLERLHQPALQAIVAIQSQH